MQRFAKSRNVEFGPTTASSGPWQGHHGPRRRGQGGSWRRPHRSHGKPPFLPRLHLWRKLLSGASRSKPGTDGVTERGKAELCLGCFLFSRSHGPPGEPSSPPPTPPRPSVSTVRGQGRCRWEGAVPEAPGLLAQQEGGTGPSSSQEKCRVSMCGCAWVPLPEHRREGPLLVRVPSAWPGSWTSECLNIY